MENINETTPNLCARRKFAKEFYEDMTSYRAFSAITSFYKGDMHKREGAELKDALPPRAWYDMTLDVIVVESQPRYQDNIDYLAEMKDMFGKTCITDMGNSLLVTGKRPLSYSVYSGQPVSLLHDEISKGKIAIPKFIENPIYSKDVNILNCLSLKDGMLAIDRMIFNSLPPSKILRAIDFGLTPNLYNGSGDTALHTLARYSVKDSKISDDYFKKVYAILRMSGMAKPEAKNLSAGQTPKDILKQAGNTALVDFVNIFEKQNQAITCLMRQALEKQYGL